MIRKSFAVLPGTTKVLDADQGIVEGWVNSTAVVDAQRDIMEPGCWADVCKAATDGKVAHPSTVWGHDWNITTGKVLSAQEYAPGSPEIPDEIREMGAGSVKIRAQYNLETQRGREAFSDVKFGAIRQWSVGFLPDESTIRYDSKGVRHIGKVAEWPEVSNVLMGASPGTMTASVKATPAEGRKERTADRLARARAMVEAFKAEWSTAFINKLPDSAFAYIEPGGKKDDDGRTTPRSLRHFPHHGEDGGVDLPHLRNALSRAAQEAAEFGDKALPHLEKHAKAEGIGDDDGKAVAQAGQKAGHSHYHVHPDGTAHTRARAHGPDVAAHDGPAEKVPHQHGHAPAGEPDTAEPKAAMCCDDCKGQDCPGCCDACCHGAAKAAKAGGGLPGDPPGVPYMTGDEAQHNGPLLQVLDGINTLIAQEIGEGGYTEYQDIIRLCCLAQDAISWAAGEANEYGDMGMYSIWDLFAAGREALSSKTEAEKAAALIEQAAVEGRLPAWLKAAITAISEAPPTSSHHPNPAQGEGDGLDWEGRFVDGFAGHSLGLHLWLQNDLRGEHEPKRTPVDPEALDGPPAEWTDRFTSPWRQQQ